MFIKKLTDFIQQDEFKEEHYIEFINFLRNDLVKNDYERNIFINKLYNSFINKKQNKFFIYLSLEKGCEIDKIDIPENIQKASITHKILKMTKSIRFAYSNSNDISKEEKNGYKYLLKKYSKEMNSITCFISNYDLIMLQDTCDNCFKIISSHKAISLNNIVYLYNYVSIIIIKLLNNNNIEKINSYIEIKNTEILKNINTKTMIMLNNDNTEYTLIYSHNESNFYTSNITENCVRSDLIIKTENTNKLRDKDLETYKKNNLNINALSALGLITIDKKSNDQNNTTAQSDFNNSSNTTMYNSSHNYCNIQSHYTPTRLDRYMAPIVPQLYGPHSSSIIRSCNYPNY